MTGREAIHAVAGALVAAAMMGAVWSLRSPTEKAKADPSAHGTDRASDELESLRSANANLVDDLRACDRTLAQLRDQGTPIPAVSASAREAERDDRDGGRGRRRGRGGEPSREDWERMAETGSLRMRTPCLRDKPWSPSQRVLDRLGLAPQDAATIREAYERSNKRMTEQIKPLCAKVLGSAEAADRVGPSACKDAIVSGSRRTDPEGTQKAAVRVAEINAGKREATKPGADSPAFEQLMLAMSKESKAFESDLAEKLGPEEAKRLAWAPEMCSDRTNVRGSERDGEGDER